MPAYESDDASLALKYSKPAFEPSSQLPPT